MSFSNETVQSKTSVRSPFEDDESPLSSYDNGETNKEKSIDVYKYKIVLDFITEFLETATKREISHKELDDAIKFIQERQNESGLKVPQFMLDHFETINAKLLSKRPNDNSLEDEFMKKFKF